MVSGLAKHDFLRTKGLNPQHGGVHERVRGWEERMVEYQAKLENTSQTFTRQVATPQKLIGAETSWEKIREWRANQAVTDFKSASILRSHLELIAKDALVKDGTHYKSSLSPRDLGQLATTLREIQKVQRLALGLSTENVGLEAQVTSERETLAEADGERMARLVNPLPPQIVITIPSNGKMAEEQ